MKLEEFWNLIEKVNAVTKQDDKRAILEATKHALMEFSPEDIIDWFNIKTEYHRLAMRPKLLEECTKIGIASSEDGFYYFIPWLIAQGRDVYLSVMYENALLSDYVHSVDETAFELYNYIADEAYSARMIKDTFSEKELAALCEQWCIDNEDRIERYSYQANVDMMTGGEKLFQSYLRGKYSLYTAAEDRGLSDELKQEIKESLTSKHISLADKIQDAESARLETSDIYKKNGMER